VRSRRPAKAPLSKPATATHLCSGNCSSFPIPAVTATPPQMARVGEKRHSHRTSCAREGTPGVAPKQPRSQLTLFPQSPARQLSTLELRPDAGNDIVRGHWHECSSLPRSWRPRYKCSGLPWRWRRSRGRAGRSCLFPALNDLPRFGEEIGAGMR
jgi:hypothetical protein